MKSTGLLVFYISENEDHELWKALASKTPDERTLIVKNILRKALANSNNINTSGSTGQVKGNEEITFEDFAVDPKTIPAGIYDELFDNIIDYDSIKARQQSPARDSDSKHQPGDSLKYEELYSTNANTNSNSGFIPGLDHVLNNVIGEEDDQEVIEYFKSRRNDDQGQ